VTTEKWTQAAIAAVQANLHVAAPICFALGLGESLAFISLLLPSSALFLGIGGAVGAVGGSFVQLWLAGSIGAFLGDILSYAAGRYFKDDIGGVWPFRRYPALVPRSQAVFERWGGLSIVGGKFIGGLRPFLPVAAGMMGMPFALFLVSSAVSCLLWAGLFLAPGFGVAWVVR
jgi:membrane protein DedA with SNARE-associated domain